MSNESFKCSIDQNLRLIRDLTSEIGGRHQNQNDYDYDYYFELNAITIMIMII